MRPTFSFYKFSPETKIQASNCKQILQSLEQINKVNFSPFSEID